jgi:hypothetical protein
MGAWAIIFISAEVTLLLALIGALVGSVDIALLGMGSTKITTRKDNRRKTWGGQC